MEEEGEKGELSSDGELSFNIRKLVREEVNLVDANSEGSQQ